MRVLAMLHLYTPYHNAGAEMAVHGLLRALVDRAHSVDVLLSRDHPAISGPYTVDGVRVHPRVDKSDPARWIADPATQPDVIVTHLENTDRATILGAHHRIPTVHVCHNTYGFTKRALLRRPDLIVANTEWMAEDLSRWWDTQRPGQPMPPLIVVRPPIHPEDYATTPGKHVTLVNVTEGKGSRTFYALAERFPQTRFLAVEGAYGDQQRSILRNVTWQRHVAGHDMQDKVYRRTRVLLMPSEYESYGRCSLEAACSGIPTIAAPTPGLREALGDAGLYADPGDVEAWARHLHHLLTPAGWSTASELARTRAKQLVTDADLDRWATAVEGVSRCSRHWQPPRTSPPATRGH